MKKHLHQYRMGVLALWTILGGLTGNRIAAAQGPYTPISDPTVSTAVPPSPLPTTVKPLALAGETETSSVLLLRNGDVVQGRIRRVGDRYEVVKPGTEMRFPLRDVRSVCRDVNEAYQQHRLTARLDSAQSRLELSQWCIRYGLLDSAREEWQAAVSIDASHPLIPLVERRIEIAAKPPEPTAAASASPTKAGPTTQELERMTRGMPPKTVEIFVKEIQPLLTNTCATGGCHGQGADTGFRLLRPAAGELPSSRLTQRNLYATLQWVDFEDPGKSPLVQRPIRPHGTSSVPIFTDRRRSQYLRLLEWCYRVAQIPSPAMQASYEENVDFDEPAMPNPKMKRNNRLASPGNSFRGMDGFDPNDGRGIEPAAYDRPAVSVSDAMGLSLQKNTTKPPAMLRPVSPRNAPAADAEVDPLDPAGFNQAPPPAAPPAPSGKAAVGPRPMTPAAFMLQSQGLPIPTAPNSGARNSSTRNPAAPNPAAQPQAAPAQPRLPQVREE